MAHRLGGGGTPLRPAWSVAFVGPSGSGKTTLIERLVPVLRARQYRVAVVKHDPHGKIDLGPPQKDSSRFARAGAEVAAVLGPAGVAALWRAWREPALEWLLASFPETDILLLEGFRDIALPKVLVLPRPGQPARVGQEEVVGPLWACIGDEEVAGVAPASALTAGVGQVPRFRPGEIEPLAEYLLARWRSVSVHEGGV